MLETVAEQLLTEAEGLLAARPDDPERADNRAQIHNTRGGLHYYESDLRNAVREFDAARVEFERLYAGGGHEQHRDGKEKRKVTVSDRPAAFRA